MMISSINVSALRALVIVQFQAANKGQLNMYVGHDYNDAASHLYLNQAIMT
jgi:hypothetical protein